MSPHQLPTISQPGRVTFVTFTQHFSPGTGALPWQGPGYYEGFAAKADVLGFDAYPLQALCRPDKLALVHDAQVDLLGLGRGKPTCQWIEVASMYCGRTGPAAVTPETVRAEMLLAIAGGATGLGLFPANLDGLLVPAVRSTLEQIERALPTLLTRRVPVPIMGEGAARVRASARSSGGGTMLVVVNADRERSASVEVHVPGLAGRPLHALGGPDQVSTSGERAQLRLSPLEAHILVAPART
jgi:hypothetical protein